MTGVEMTTEATKLITAEELFEMGDIGRCELIYGELVMMSPAGAEHGVVAARFVRYLGEFVDQHGLGAVFSSETGFTVERDPDLVRGPDAAFVGRDRIGTKVPRGYFDGVPDLAVEVVSPGERRRDVAEKVNMWLAHGARVVWVADPRQMTVVIHRVGNKPQTLRKPDEIRDEPLLRGFVLPLSKVFRLP
jgi:Uma2 family endonuclease